jgi:hypothetical protein
MLDGSKQSALPLLHDMKNVPEIEFTTKETLVAFIKSFSYDPPPGNEEAFIIVKNVKKEDMDTMVEDPMLSKLIHSYYFAYKPRVTEILLTTSKW